MLCALSPYRCLIKMAAPTPASESGPDPANIQSVSRACTVPSRRCRTAPNVLKIAPWKMSVPTAYVGLKPKRITRIGVIKEPPPIPVSPTSAPSSSPVSVNCQVIGSGSRDDHPGGDGVVCRLVDEDERARLPVLVVAV